MNNAEKINAAILDLGNDALWETLAVQPQAVTALEGARRQTQNTLDNIVLSEQEIPLRVRMGLMTSGQADEETLKLIGRKRGTLKFLRMVETRQATMRGATVTQLHAAIEAHRTDAEESGDQPTEYDLELWEQVAA